MENCHQTLRPTAEIKEREGVRREEKRERVGVRQSERKQGREGERGERKRERLLISNEALNYAFYKNLDEQFTYWNQIQVFLEMRCRLDMSHMLVLVSLCRVEHYPQYNQPHGTSLTKVIGWEILL